MRENDRFKRRIRNGSGGKIDADELTQKLSQAVHEAFDAVEDELGRGASAQSAPTAGRESRDAVEAVELPEAMRKLPERFQLTAQSRDGEPEMVNVTVQEADQMENPK